MATLNDPRRRLDGITRRESLKVGALPLLGGLVGGAGVMASEPRREIRPNSPAKSVVLIYLQGGPPTQDMFDLKPDAPDGIRSEFRPIATSAPGITVCDQMPRTARWMHKAAVVRSVYHNGGCHKNMPMYTGYDINLPDEEFRESDPPSMGSVCAYLESGPTDLPAYVYLPCSLGWGEGRKKGGPHAGFLGQRFDPFCTECTAYVDHPPDDIWNPQVLRGAPHLGNAERLPDVPLDRLNGRRRLLDQFDVRAAAMESAPTRTQYGRQQQMAFDMLSSAAVREVFDLGREADRVRERYGRTLFGSSALLARRLVEAGVRFINVSWDNFSKRFSVSNAAWDTHENNYPMLRDTLLPGFDHTYSAFIEDLELRGLLDQTLVVVMGEMGRTPRINAKGGRDHWTHCYSVLFAGAGIRGGMVHGASDRQAAFIQDNPVHIRDICATIYHCLGIDPAMTVPDRANRPIAITHGGEPVRAILS